MGWKLFLTSSLPRGWPSVSAHTHNETLPQWFLHILFLKHSLNPHPLGQLISEHTVRTEALYYYTMPSAHLPFQKSISAAPKKVVPLFHDDLFGMRVGRKAHLNGY